MKQNTNYLNKKDMLNFIHNSKATYSWYIDSDKYKKSKYCHYDMIICGSDMYEEAKAQLMLQLINTKRRDKLEPRTSILRVDDIGMLTQEDYEHIDNKIMLFNEDTFLDDSKLVEKAKLAKYNRELYSQSKKRVGSLPDDVVIDTSDLIIRVYTYSHIPTNTTETGKEKKVADHHNKVNFPPYVHYGFYNDKFQIVAKSHHTKDNVFSVTHGEIIRELAETFMLQSRRVSYKHNTKGYSYLDDMVSHANVQLVQVGLQFNELFSDNPFAYFTSIITNSFKTILKDEKRSQRYRDLMLMEAGFNPSITEQINQENSRQEHWNDILSANYKEETNYDNDWDNYSDNTISTSTTFNIDDESNAVDNSYNDMNFNTTEEEEQLSPTTFNIDDDDDVDDDESNAVDNSYNDMNFNTTEEEEQLSPTTLI